MVRIRSGYRDGFGVGCCSGFGIGCCSGFCIGCRIGFSVGCRSVAERPLSDGVALSDRFRNKAIVILDNAIDEGGDDHHARTQPHRFLCPDQGRRAAAAGLGLAFVGGGPDLWPWIVPGPPGGIAASTALVGAESPKALVRAADEAAHVRQERAPHQQDGRSSARDRPRDARGLLATLTAERGLAGHLIAATLGHEDVRTTMTAYAAPGAAVTGANRRGLVLLEGGLKVGESRH